ncbi:MAG TPA: hypothetical protein VGF83_03235 [Actinomycetota bacterium]|jgi:hypothetical protein
MTKVVWCGFLALIQFPVAIAVCQAQSRDESKQSRDGDKSSARSVKDQVLTSKELPAVSLKFDKAFKYMGSQTFVLYDVARAEQHFFVDADAKGRIKRMYWIQFEGYLPSNTHTYRYKSTKTVKIGGLEFIADASARNVKDNPGRPDSDGSRARAFLDKKGHRMATDDVLAQRLVHVVDEGKRNELMIIYMEDLAPMKLTAKDLAPGGRVAAQWDEIAKGLLERAENGVEISR